MRQATTPARGREDTGSSRSSTRPSFRPAAQPCTGRTLPAPALPRGSRQGSQGAQTGRPRRTEPVLRCSGRFPGPPDRRHEHAETLRPKGAEKWDGRARPEPTLVSAPLMDSPPDQPRGHVLLPACRRRPASRPGPPRPCGCGTVLRCPLSRSGSGPDRDQWHEPAIPAMGGETLDDRCGGPTRAAAPEPRRKTASTSSDPICHGPRPTTPQ